MSVFKRGKAEGFDDSIALPENADQQEKWQKANRGWWEQNPMRYDFTTELGLEEFSRGFYEEIDRRFYAAARPFAPYKKIPFDCLIDFESLANKDVLEIGVGSGSHAQLLSTHAGSYTGIDLTDYAIHSTTQRMKQFGIKANVLQMDAEQMKFEDESFDYIWSWGVIHHSSNTRAILQQMYRVLRPGGRAAVMVYHRSFWIYYMMAGFFRGILLGELRKTGSLDRVLQEWTDGAIARYYTIPEWKELANSEKLDVTGVRILGEKVELFPLPPGGLKNAAMKVFPDSLSRFITNTCKQGRFLYAEMQKPE